MKKILLILIVFTYTTIAYTQDSIVNYLDRKGDIVEKNNAVEIETIVKKDTLWKVTKYYRNGKIKKQGHFKTKDKKMPVGEFVTFNMKGKTSSILFYDLFGKKKGPRKAWFDNGKINSTGMYLDNMKEGVWKYYHYNGNKACIQYFKNDSILKTILYNENGDVITGDYIIKRKPTFKGGLKRFKSELKKITNNVNYKIKGKIYVNFIIDTNGKITNVVIGDTIPEMLNKQIVSFFEEIEGWQPAIHMNRKLPFNYSIPLNFR